MRKVQIQQQGWWVEVTFDGSSPALEGAGRGGMTHGDARQKYLAKIADARKFWRVPATVRIVSCNEAGDVVRVEDSIRITDGENMS